MWGRAQNTAYIGIISGYEGGRGVEVAQQILRWKRPKEVWEERVYIFCSFVKVETEKHFILECETLKDNGESYGDILTSSSWDNLFSEGFVEKLGAFIVKLHRKRVEYIKQMKKQSVPQAIFSLVDVKIISFFLSFFLAFFN